MCSDNKQIAAEPKDGQRLSRDRMGERGARPTFPADYRPNLGPTTFFRALLNSFQSNRIPSLRFRQSEIPIG